MIYKYIYFISLGACVCMCTCLLCSSFCFLWVNWGSCFGDEFALSVLLHAVLFSFCFCLCCMSAWCNQNHQSLHFVMTHFIEFRSRSSTAEIMVHLFILGVLNYWSLFHFIYYRKSCGAVEDLVLLSCSRTACSIASKNSEINRIFVLWRTMPRFRTELKEAPLCKYSCTFIAGPSISKCIRTS